LLDFDLRIWAADGKYVAQVMDSPAGRSERETLRPPFGSDSNEILSLKLENAVLRGRGYRGVPVSCEEKILREFGSEMFRIVFREAASIAQKLSSSLDIVEQRSETVDGLRIKLTIEPPEMAALPWEYVFDERQGDTGYMCLRHKSPMVRFLDFGRATTTFSIKGRLNVLGIVANPRGEWDNLDTEQERNRIDEAIASIPDKNLVNFRWVPGDTHEHLLEMMQREAWHVFHFIGHGGVQNDEGFIVLGDGRGGADQLTAADLALTLQSSGALKLAILNCCESARGTANPAEALVRLGIPAVVAMQYPITDEAAVRFSSQFYKSLLMGQSLERSLTMARVWIRKRSKLEWAIPVLFTRASSDALFKIEPGERGSPEERSSQTSPPSSPESTSSPSDYEQKRSRAQAELKRLFS